MLKRKFANEQLNTVANSAVLPKKGIHRRAWQEAMYIVRERINMYTAPEAEYTSQELEALPSCVKVLIEAGAGCACRNRSFGSCV